MRASSVVNCQLTRFDPVFRSRRQAAISSARRRPSSILRARHCRPSTLSSAFGDVQPTAMLGRVVDLQTLGEPPGFLRRKRFIERRRRVRIQVVHDQDDAFGERILLLQKIPQGKGPVDPCPPLGHTHITPPAQRLAEHENVACATTLVFAVIPQRLTRPRGQRPANFRHELLAGFIHANHWMLGVVPSSVNFQDILHPPDEFRIVLFRKTPLLFQPRLNRVFLACSAPFQG